jgi:hypothetical protein
LYWRQYFNDSYRLTPSLAYEAIALLLALMVVVVVARTRPDEEATLSDHGATRHRVIPNRAWWFALCAFALALPLFTSTFVLDRFVNSGDEFAYLWQAKAFLAGHLSYDAPPLGETFVAFRTWIHENHWVSQYPPGWPLVLAAAGLVSVPPWAVNPLLGALSVAALAALLRKAASPGTAFGLVVVYAATSFFIFNAASYFPHIATALLVMGFVAATQIYLRHGTRGAALGMGAALGAIGLIRPYSALLLIILLAGWYLVTRRRITKTDFLIPLAGLPFLVALAAYQDLVMGSPWVSTYAAEYELPAFKLELTRNTVFTTLRLLEELLAWSGPLLITAYAAALFVKARAKRLDLYDLILPLFVAAYVIQGYAGGNRYGPRYYFDAYPLIFLSIATALPLVRAWRFAIDRRLGLHFVALCLLHALVVYPFAAALFYRIVRERQEVYDLAAEAGLKDAVVVVESSAGATSPMQPHDLARNEPGLAGDVLYARGEAADVAAIRSLFPERSVWIYEREDDRPNGRHRRAP